MTTAKKLNAREQLVQFFLEHGWELDPNRKQWNKRGRYNLEGRELVQHPTAFRRPAHDGLFWSVELDYTVRSDWSNLNSTRLRSITAKLVDAEDAQRHIGPNAYDYSINIEPLFSDSYGTLNYAAWSVTWGPTGEATLKQRAEYLAVNPDLVVWLAVEKMVTEKARRAEAAHRRAQEMKARQRPLAITVGKDEWETLTNTLYRASNKLLGAHGATNLPQAVADAEAAIAAIKAVLVNPEALS